MKFKVFIPTKYKISKKVIVQAVNEKQARKIVAFDYCKMGRCKNYTMVHT